MRNFTSIILLVSVVALSFIGLSYYVKTVHGQTSGLITSNNSEGASTGNGAQVLSLLNRLKRITLDGKIFSTEAFKKLEDDTVTIVSQPVGRSNPYLPVGGSAAVKKTNTNTASPKSSPPQFLVK